MSGSRPKIALVAHDVGEAGGMERVCAELIRRGADRFDFVVVSVTLAAELQPIVHRWVRVRVPARPFPLKFTLFWLIGGRRLRSVNADLVQTVGAIVPNRIDIAAVHFCHAAFREIEGLWAAPDKPLLRRLNTSLTRLLALLAERLSYRPGRVRRLVAVSSGVRDELRTHYPQLAVDVVPNGVALDRFQPNPIARGRLRVERGVGNATVALFVGGDWARKGLDISLQAVSRLVRAGRDIRLWVVGTGDVETYRRLAVKLGVASYVEFFGQRDDTERFYDAADMLLLPTAYEAFSLVTLEAAASGLPVIMPEVNGAFELVGKDEAGLLVARTEEDVATAIARLIDDPDLCKRLSVEARRRALRFSWDDTAEAVAGLYRSLLDDIRQPLGGPEGAA